jgi:PAS domain S-box-containing protein
VVEIPILCADGEVRTLLWNSATVYAADGVTPVATIAQGQDITERIAAEQSLRESESRFRQLVDCLPQLVWTCQADGQCDSLSRKWVAYTGVPEAPQLGFGWLEQLHPDDRAPTVAAWEAAVAAGTDFHVEFRIRRHDGEYRWFDTQAVRLRDADGNTVKWVGANTDLTSRRLAETALADSEDKFRYMFDHSPVPRSTTRPSGEIEVNEAFLEMVGYTREEIGERATWRQISHPDDAARTDGIVASMVSGERTSARFEKRYLHKDGSVIWADVSTALRRDADGNADYFMTTVVDITERKHAEDALRESEEKYRGLFANAQVGMFRSRLDGSAILAVNPKLCEIFGYTEEEMLADPATIRWADPEARTTMIEELQAAEKLIDYEVDILNSSGETRTCLVSMELNRERGFLEGSATDITERKRTEEALLAFARRQSTLFESMQDGLGMVDAAGVLLDVNPALCTMTGFSREELIGAGPPHPFWPPEVSEAIGEAFAPAVRGDTKESELTFMRKSGERFAVVVSPSSVKDSEGRVELMFATMKDITERKHAEDEILGLNAELEQRVIDRTAQLDATNTELEAFAYSVSHDLRAPLRHISGFSALLAEQVGDGLDERSRHYVDTISNSVREMGVLIDDLLQFSRTGRSELQIGDVDMEQALAEALEPLRQETSEREIEWSICPLPRVVGDHALLRQVWANLLGNAVKFSRVRSPARIEVGTRDGDGMSEDVFYVRDNGVGFDMQYAHKLFGVFQRLHSTAEFEGTGIGLANVQRIIDRLGGRVWAEAELDKGATFYFSLPRRKETSL